MLFWIFFGHNFHTTFFLLFLFFLSSWSNMNTNDQYLGVKNGEDQCLVDFTTTYTILKDKKYFSHTQLVELNVRTISRVANIIKDSRKANIMFPRRTRFLINNAFFSSRSKRNVLSFKDICHSGYHIETTNESIIKYLCITSTISGLKTYIRKITRILLWII